MPHYLTLTDDDLDLLDEPTFEKFRRRKPQPEQPELKPQPDHPRPEPPPTRQRPGHA